MQKHKLAVGALLVPLIAVAVFGMGRMAEKIDVDGVARAREEKNAVIISLENSLALERTLEVKVFCDYVDTMKKYNKFVEIEDLERHKSDCFEENGAGKMPDEFNSKGEPHSLVYIPDGKGAKERTKDFVLKNCTPEIYEEFDYIWEYSEENGIIGSVPFAVIWADSQCGQMLTTPNNPGNVNNNDRGNRVGFFTMRDGLEAVVDTLNNRYISGIETIGHLSQGGRSVIGSKFSCSNAPAPYKCYATSTENWNNNSMRSLRSIYGEDVNAEFKIRTQ